MNKNLALSRPKIQKQSVNFSRKVPKPIIITNMDFNRPISKQDDFKDPGTAVGF